MTACPELKWRNGITFSHHTYPGLRTVRPREHHKTWRVPEKVLCLYCNGIELAKTVLLPQVQRSQLLQEPVSLYMAQIPKQTDVNRLGIFSSMERAQRK